MKRIIIGLLIGILFLTACGSTPPLPQPTSDAVPRTSTPSPLPSTTPTITITPLPTIPTFTPTFDVSTIVTVTPAPKAECPTIDPTIKVEDYLPSEIKYPTSDVTNEILEFLNKGGEGQNLIKRFDQIYSKSEYHGGYEFLDVTGDQVPEFLYVELNYVGKPSVFSCRGGKFEILATLPGDYDFLEYALETEELNANGVPEIIVKGTSGASFPVTTIYLYEWNRQSFSVLGQATIKAMRQIQVIDADGNGTKEIFFSGDNPSCLSCSNFIPQRQRTITYGWNGSKFVEITNEYEPPEYRFQAVQDADSVVLSGKFDEAFRSYQEAISNEKLEWWSPERMLYEQDVTYRWIPGITPVPEPIEDTTEYPRLAVYAYYRIMLLQLVQNQESDATVTYNTLQKEFGNDPYAYPYVEMASAFWEAYQSTAHSVYDGCAAAIQYAVEHPEILIPLGSDYHGAQSHVYVPADVCPFR